MVGGSPLFFLDGQVEKLEYFYDHYDDLYSILQRIKNGEIVEQKPEKIEKLTGRKLELEKRLPRLGDVPHTHADVSKAKAHFGYEPEIKFDEGLAKTVEWFQTRRA